MNDEVKRLLKESSRQVKHLKEKRDTRDAKEKEALSRFLDKARNNKYKFYGFMLKKAVLEYTDDPVSVLNHYGHKINKKYTERYTTLDTRRTKGLPGSKMARLYNYGVSGNETVFWFDPGNNKPIPVIVKDLPDCTVQGDVIKIEFYNELIRDLSIEAHNNELEEGSFVDYGLVSRLQVAYNEIRLKAEEMYAYLKKLEKNAQIIYCDTYKKLLKAYRIHHNESEFGVSIETKYDLPKDLSYNIARKFNEAAANASAEVDRIILCSHIAEKGNEIFIPVQKSVLESMFRQDISMGLKYASIGSYDSGVVFYTDDFENSIINMGEEEPTL